MHFAPELAVSSWSVHTLFRNRQLDAEMFPAFCRQLFGVRAIEYFEGDYHENIFEADEAYAEKIRRACDDAGVRISCIGARNDLTIPDQNSPELMKDVERLYLWIRFCEILGYPTIRINTGLRALDSQGVGRMVEHLIPVLVLNDKFPLVQQ